MGEPRQVVVVTAVLPRYRQQFLRLLDGSGVTFYSGSVHCDPTVRTGVDPDSYTLVDNVFVLGRRMFVQRATLRPGIAASVAVVDLNPRSLSSWAILAGRRALGRRTLVWGHLFPRAGRDSATKPLRKAMVCLSSGVITYTWSERRLAAESSGKPSWAATNALYTREELATHQPSLERSDLLFVGRLEPDKKLDLLLDGFAEAIQRGQLSRDVRLVLIGEGSAEPGLRERVAALDIEDRVDFAGRLYDFAELSKRYATAAAGVSAGYGGLQITQSLGFGVPIVLPLEEPHAPEVELAEDYCTYWFERDSSASLADALARVFTTPITDEDRERVRAIVSDRYSSEVMADGFASAVFDRAGRAS